MDVLLNAAKFAAEKHIGQKRKDSSGAPYVNHVIEVAEHVARVGKITNESVLVAALLHDTIEDTETTNEEVERAFGPEVLSIVLECTDDKTLEKAERKRLQIVNAPHKSLEAKAVKIADKTCNLRTLATNPPVGWSLQRQREYFEWAGKVLEGLKGVHPELDAEAARVLEEGLREIEVREIEVREIEVREIEVREIEVREIEVREKAGEM